MSNLASQQPTLFEKLGGESAVNAAVDMFYRKVLLDDRISAFFEDTDMDQQIAKQKAFLTFAFGGNTQYNGKSMRDAHTPLVKKGLNDSHVDTVIELLGETLQELQVPAPLIQEVANIANSVRDDVLNRVAH